MWVSRLKQTASFVLCFLFLHFIVLSAEAVVDSGWYFDGSSWKTKSGDNLDWAEVDWDDSNWRSIAQRSSILNEGEYYDIPSGVFWIRSTITITKPDLASEINSLFNSIRGARDIYWDGHLLGSSGVPADTITEEQAGLLYHWISIPDRLLEPGDHQIAIRISSNFDKIIDGPLIRDLYLWNDSFSIPELFSNYRFDGVMYGFAAAMCALYFLIFIFTERKLSYLLFSLFCGFVSVAKYLDTYRIVHSQTYTYKEEFIVKNILAADVGVIAFLFPVFMLAHFSINKWRWHLLWITPAVLGTFLLTNYHDQRTVYLVGVGGGSACGIAGWAVYKRRRGSLYALLGVFACVLPIVVDSLENWSAFGYAILVGSILIPLTSQIGKEKIDHQKMVAKKAQLEASRDRLEAELLKHSIHPHFMMNTLNALVDWVEESPKEGVEFIHALSRHFRILLKISGQKEIEMGQEIELCQSFLAIMSYRLESQFKLSIEGVDPSDRIPPCVLHTLVENGVTHNDYKDNDVVFQLRAEMGEERRYYSLVTPLELSDEENSQILDHEISNGTGLKYVESRLEESYPGRWDLWNGIVKNTWVARIEIFHDLERKAQI